MQKKSQLTLIAAALIFFIGMLFQHKTKPVKKSVHDSIQVAIDPIANTLLFGGDRWLAANVDTIRALILSIDDLSTEDYNTLGALQNNISILNPSNADNYYIAQAILPWNGQALATMKILDRSISMRKNDIMPAFFAGFNSYFFLKDFEAAGKYFTMSAEQANEKDRQSLLFLAAKYSEKRDDTLLAIGILRDLQEKASNKQLKLNLQARIVRLEQLLSLKKAALDFKEKYKINPEKIEDLLEKKLIKTIPNDPLGMGYTIDPNGTPQIRNATPPNEGKKQ